LVAQFGAMKNPVFVALLSFVPVSLLALLLPQSLPNLITVAVVAELGFLIPVANRLIELKKEQGYPVPFRERHPVLLSAVEYVCYAAIALGSLTEPGVRLIALTGAASFAASKLWLGKSRLWPYQRSSTPGK
jgi:hypothetical protein